MVGFGYFFLLDFLFVLNFPSFELLTPKAKLSREIIAKVDCDGTVERTRIAIKVVRGTGLLSGLAGPEICLDSVAIS